MKSECPDLTLPSSKFSPHSSEDMPDNNTEKLLQRPQGNSHKLCSQAFRAEPYVETNLLQLL